MIQATTILKTAPITATIRMAPITVQYFSGTTGNAIPSQVLAGRTFSTETLYGETGTMVNVGQQNITPGATGQAISQGYHDGTGVVAGDADLVTNNIKAGVSIFGVTGDANVVDTSDAAMQPEWLVAGASGYAGGAKVVGTAPTYSMFYMIPTTENQEIPPGFHTTGNAVYGSPDLISANIKYGASIFEVNGKYEVVDTSDADAAEGDLLMYKTAYVNGVKVTGTIIDWGVQEYYPDTLPVAIATGYHTGSYIAGEPNFIPENIKAGVGMWWGMVGTYDPTYDASFIGTDWTADGILYTITVTALEHGLGETDSLKVDVKNALGDSVRTHVNVAVDGTVTITANYNFVGSYIIVGGA